MDRRFWTVLGASLTLGLTVSLIFYQVAARTLVRPRAVARKDVVIAAVALPVGSIIRRESLRVVPIAADAFPGGGFSSVDEVADRPVVAGILANEPVLEARLGGKGSGVGLAPVIPSGMRAVSVRVNEVVGVAGFVLPGMRVDVLVTGRPPGMEGSMTTTVLQNIMVLSSGQTTQAEKPQAINTPVVTLLVTPEQAEILTLATNEGRIHLGLRNGNDQKIEPTPGRELRQLYAGWAKAQPAAPGTAKPARAARPPAPAAAPSPATPPPPPAPRLMIIRGTQKVEETPGAKAGE